MLSYFSRQKTAANKWEHSSAGRASALQAEGHRFEPYCSHHYGLVVQLVRTLACHARGRRFDPDPGRQFASVAQSVEQGTENPRVGSSTLSPGTMKSRSHHAAFFIFGDPPSRTAIKFLFRKAISRCGRQSQKKNQFWTCQR